MIDLDLETGLKFSFSSGPFCYFVVSDNDLTSVKQFWIGKHGQGRYCNRKTNNANCTFTLKAWSERIPTDQHLRLKFWNSLMCIEQTWAGCRCNKIHDFQCNAFGRQTAIAHRAHTDIAYTHILQHIPQMNCMLPLSTHTTHKHREKS